MVRTVRVRLELEDSGFKRSLRDDAAAMRGFDTDVKTLGRSADRTGAQLRDSSTDVKRLGDDVKRSSRDVTLLSQSLDDSRKSLRGLADEYKKTGSVELTRYRNLTGELRKLERAKKDLDKLGGQDQAGLFSRGLSTLQGISPSLTQALVYGAVAAAPLIGATLGGAVTAGVGGGVIAGGILAAARDPKVKAAWSEVGKTAGDQLSGAASPFTGVLIKGSETFARTVNDVMPHLRADFLTLAPVADRLFLGASGFVRELMPGIDALSRQSGPIIDMISRELPRLGAAISRAFEDIGRGAAGGKEALTDLLHGIENTIMAIGWLTMATERWYEGEKALAHFFTGDWSGAVDRMVAAMSTTKDVTVGVGDAVKATSKAVTDAIVPIGAEASITSDQFKSLASQINATAETADTLAGMMTDKLLGALLGVDQATLGFAEAQTRLSDSIVQNGLQLDIHTAKGQANRDAVLGAVAANIRQYDAMLASGQGADVAAAAYDQNTGSLIKQLQAAHFTSDQIFNLIGQYAAVPDQVNTKIATEGLSAAVNDLKLLLIDLFTADGYVARSSVYVTTYYQQVRGPGSTAYNQQVPYAARQRYGGVVSYAQGGVDDYKMSLRPDYTARSGLLKPSNPGTILAGEPSTGGEVFGPRLGVSHERGLQLANTLAGWHGGQVVRAGPMGGAAGDTLNLTVNVSVPQLNVDDAMLANKIATMVVKDGMRGGAIRTAVRRWNDPHK